MAKILEQKEIDRALACFGAVSKINNAYYELFGEIDNKELTKRGNLKSVLEEIVKAPIKNADQNVFVKQCKDILSKLDKKK